MKILETYYFNEVHKVEGQIGLNKRLIPAIKNKDTGFSLMHPLSTSIKGISWNYLNEENRKGSVNIYDEGKPVYGYPSVNMDLMVVVFNRSSNHHPYPNNMVVYEADGSIRHIISAPYIPAQLRLNKNEINLKSWEEGIVTNILWSKKDKDLIMTVDIEYGYDKVLTFEFDPIKGKFGELIRKSRK